MNPDSGVQSTASSPFVLAVQQLAITGLAENAGSVTGDLLASANPARYVRVSQNSGTQNFDIAEVQVCGKGVRSQWH